MASAKLYNTVDYQPELQNGLLTVVYKHDGPASYATGGEALAKAATLGLPSGATVVGKQAVATGGYTAEYDDSNEKTIWYASSGTEVTATTDLSAEHAVVTVWYTR
jgi:hypothetical protein